LINVLRRFAKFDAALKAAFERALASPACVDLRFDHHQLLALRKKIFRDFFRRLGRITNFARRDSDAILGEQLFGLVFVNVHLWKFGSSSGSPTANYKSAIRQITNLRYRASHLRSLSGV